MLRIFKAVSTVFLLISACLMLSNHAVMGYPPRQEYQVSIYADAYFKGAAQTLEEGRYNIGDLRIGNDVLSSLRVPAGWRVTLYEHENYTGRSKTFTSDCQWVGDDFNDLTSSISVERVHSMPPALVSPRVAIYADAYFKGAVQTLEEGRYNIGDLRIGNDVLSSLRVPAGWRVTLYEHENYTGRSRTFTSDCQWVGDDFNDLTSSISVERVHSMPPVYPPAQAPPQYRNHVTIYVDANYQGAVQVLEEGWYNMGKLRIGNDTLSSLRVPPGWRVTLYEHGDFKGRFRTMRSDCPYIGDDFNDLTSSIRVEYLGPRFHRRY